MTAHHITFTPGEDGLSKIAGKKVEIATWGMSQGHGIDARYGYRVSWGKESTGISHGVNLVDAPPFRLERATSDKGGDALKVTVEAPESKTRIRLKTNKTPSIPKPLVEGECLLLRDPETPIWEAFTAVTYAGVMSWQSSANSKVVEGVFADDDGMVEWVLVAAPK